MLQLTPATTQFIIPTGDWDLKNCNFTGLTFAFSQFTLKLADGCHISSVNSITGNVTIESLNNTGNSISCINPDLCVFIANIGCVIKNSGNAPIFTALPGFVNVLGFLGGRSEIGNPAVAILEVPAGQTSLIYAVNGAVLTDNIVSGPIGSTVVLQHDGSINFPFPTQSLFFGTLINNPLGVSGGSGPTSFRPATGLIDVSVGCEYFDTDLGIPVWWTGLIWVDATGAPA